MMTRLKVILGLALMAALLLAGCQGQEAQVPLPDPDDVDVPDVDAPEADADVDAPDVNATGGEVDVGEPDINYTPGAIDIEWPDIDLAWSDFNIELPEFTGEPGEVDVNVTTPEDEGLLVFAVTERSPDLSRRVSSVWTTFDGVHIDDPQEGWEELFLFEERFDLLELGEEGRTSLIVSDEVDPRTYEMFRVDVSEATVDDQLGRTEAELIREELLIPVSFTVDRAETTVIVLDFAVQDSLRLANRGTADERYLFAPSFLVRIYEDADVVRVEGGEKDSIRVRGEPDRVIGPVGQDARGDIVAGVPIAWNADVSIDAETENVTVEVPAGDVDADVDLDRNVRGGE